MKRSAGSGTKVSGYIESPVAKKCSTCEYYPQKDRCNNKIVGKDPKVKTDESSGLKIVSGQNGCCSYWEAED